MQSIDHEDDLIEKILTYIFNHLTLALRNYILAAKYIIVVALIKVLLKK